MLATPTFEIEQSTDLMVSRFLVADRPRQAKRRSRKVAAGATCLVISPDALRQKMFGQSAERCGWQRIVCEDMAQALEHLESGNIGMILIDIASAGDASLGARRRLVERLVKNKNALTVVCGRTSDLQEEMWARELGVWMYLPGVAPESDLDPMLLAGREASVRLHQRQGAVACTF